MATLPLGGPVTQPADLENSRQQGFGSVAAGTGQIAETSVAYHDRVAREAAFLNAVWTKQPHAVAGMIVRLWHTVVVTVSPFISQRAASTASLMFELSPSAGN